MLRLAMFLFLLPPHNYHRQPSCRGFPAEQFCCILILFLLASLLGVCSATAQNNPKEYEVIGYSEPNFQGEFVRWQLPPGYRHLLVRSIPLAQKYLRSMKTGGGVQVKFFNYPNLSGDIATNGVIGSEIGYAGWRGIQSFVIFPASLPQPTGVQILGRTTGKVQGTNGQFYALPENPSLNTICHQDTLFSFAPMDSLRIFGLSMSVELYYQDGCQGNKVAITGGASPAEYITSHDPKTHPLSLIQRKVRSIKVESTFPLYQYLPKPPKVYEIPGALLDGSQNDLTIAGEWLASNNQHYLITQNEQTASWWAPALQQKAELTLAGRNLTATFTDQLGMVQTIGGTITEVAGTVAVTIKWDNAVTFSRRLATAGEPDIGSLPVQPTIQVAGTWRSSHNAVYTISQQGTDLSWTVAGSDEQATGVLRERQLTMTWQGTAGSGSGIGTITQVGGQGQAVEILWSNTIRFHRVSQ